MSTSQKSLYKKYEDATRSYYGTDRDPLKFVPVAGNRNVAHELATQVERHLGAISEEDITASALRAQQRNKMFSPGHQEEFETLKEKALNDRLRRAVVNVELSHASMAPGDFNEDAMKAGAYEMGIGHVVLPKPSSPPEK